MGSGQEPITLTREQLLRDFECKKRCGHRYDCIVNRAEGVVPKCFTPCVMVVKRNDAVLVRCADVCNEPCW